MISNPYTLLRQLLQKEQLKYKGISINGPKVTSIEVQEVFRPFKYPIEAAPP